MACWFSTSTQLLCSCLQEGIYSPSMVYMDYVYFNITVSGSLRVGQSLQIASDGYSTHVWEATVFSSGIFGWISYYYAARHSNDFNAQPLFWQVAGHWLLLHVWVYFLISYIRLLQFKESTRIQARGLRDICPQGMFLIFSWEVCRKDSLTVCSK
jgi:hypothetical protein